MPVEEEEVARVARVSLEDLEGFAKELVEEGFVGSMPGIPRCNTKLGCTAMGV